VAGFRVGYVFDVADTEGEDLPDDGLNVVHPVGVAPEGMWDTLVQRVEGAGFTVRFGPGLDESLGSAWGRTHYGDRTVTVKSTADPAGACKTLAHDPLTAPAATGRPLPLFGGGRPSLVRGAGGVPLGQPSR
jgi:hypothetical protein